jgi:hypothetical protein
VKALKNQITELETGDKYSREDENILTSLKEELGEAEKNQKRLLG